MKKSVNNLLAKPKGKIGSFLKVISGKLIFDLPTLDDSIEYRTDYKLEDDQWFAIKQFSEQEYCIDLLKKRVISTDYDIITQNQYNNINYLCSCQNDIYYFQKVNNRHYVSKKILHLNRLTITESEPIIVINEFADAIYKKKRRHLIF